MGRKCICNALIANVGEPQVRAGKYVEQGIVTSGDDINGVAQFVKPGQTDYTAADVVAALMQSLPASA